MLTGGSYFEYDGISSDEFGELMIYYIGDPGGTYEDPLYTQDIYETRLLTRHDPIFHGLSDNKNTTTRDIVFGFTSLVDRETVDEVAAWLTGTNGYAKLVINEDDLEDYYYLCIFQELTTVSSDLVYAFKATMVMYDQFAHEDPVTTTYVIEDGQIVTTTGELRDTVTFNNDSSLHGYSYPKVTLQVATGCDEFQIINLADNDGNRPFLFHDITSLGTSDGSDVIIEVDNKNRIISSPNIDNTTTMYRCFGNIDEHYQYFFRLLNGDNTLSFVGSGTVSIEHENLRKVGM